jgi:choline dehydrogenase-like flavoprotein
VTKPFLLTDIRFIAPIPESDKNEQFLSTGNFLLYPYSHGHIHITGPDINGEVDLKTGILSERSGFDHAMAMWLYKKQREVVRRLDVYRGEYAPLHPAFAADSDAACRKREGPLPADVKDIVYNEEDNAILDQWVRASLAQNWHGSGTCKMAPLSEGGVVDPGLGVHGVEALKIADLSVVPVNVAANTANLAFAIGEKAADIFARELEMSA